MSSEPNDSIVVDSNDDLEAFDDMFHNRPKVEEAEVKDDVVDTAEVDTGAEQEDPTKAETKDLDTSPDGEEREEPEEKPKKVNRVQERINELTARAKEAERALEELRKAKEEQPEKPKQETAVVDDGPKPDDVDANGEDKYPLGEFDPAYIRDMARHTINTEWKAREQKEAVEQAKRQETEAREQIHNQWVEKLSPITEKHDDFLEKTLELESTFEGLNDQYSDYLVQTIKSLDHGPEVLYYFANHLEEAKSFVQKGPLEATLALGELNAMFKGNTRKPDTKVSNAPPPPQLNKGSKTRTAIPADTDDLDAFSTIFFPKKGR